MKSHSVFHLVAMFALLFSLLGSVMRVTPVRADLPIGLTAADWEQILSLFTPTQQVYLKASNTDTNDEFGFSVAISGNTLVVGAYNEDSNATGLNGNQTNNSALNSGAVYVFIRTGFTWSQQAYLKASNSETDDHFGRSVAISGDTIVVGAPGEDSGATGVNGNQADNSIYDSGAVYIFTRANDNWSQQAYLKASNPDTANQFGWSVSIFENMIAVGADGESSSADGLINNSILSSGAVYIFTRLGNIWSQQAHLKASNSEAFDMFGWSVSLYADTLVVGALHEDSSSTGVNGNEADNSADNSGAVYVFTRSGALWTQEAYLKASNTDATDNFGWSVAIDGDTLIVGSPNESSNATNVNGDQSNNSAPTSGAVYVFSRSGSVWSQQAYLKASNSFPNFAFGQSVTISGDIIVVGVFREDSKATGVNGDQSDYSAPYSGAAYVFFRSGNSWSQTAYLKASNTNEYDHFGTALALSEDTLVVGANMEDSNAAGTNGDQANNSALESGAAYVFTLNITTPTVTTITRASANPTSAPMVDFHINFSEPVTGVDTGDFSLTTTGLIGASISAVSGLGSSYTVRVETGHKSGTLRLDIQNAATITDLAGNSLAGLPFTSGETYTINKSPTFADVPFDHWAWQYVESIYSAGITSGCASAPSLVYCPNQPTTRAQMAIYTLKGIHGRSYIPPIATGTIFNDITVNHWAAAWVEQLAKVGITAGCGNGNYCPDQVATTRAQMAVFLLRARHGAGYIPPAVNGSTGFSDVPVDYWAAAWIKQFAAEGITSGCGGGNYCPDGTLTRAEMAVFLQRTFNLPLP